MSGKFKKLKLIGRREYIELPELHVSGLEAKIDTGAYTSALHCHDISVKEIDGKKVLCFYLLDPFHPEYNDKEHRFENFYRKSIKSSSGEKEERYIIKTLVKIGRKRIWSNISLTDRAGMRYPVLIGRKMIKNKFLIDVHRVHTGGLVLSKAFPYLSNKK